VICGGYSPSLLKFTAGETRAQNVGIFDILYCICPCAFKLYDLWQFHVKDFGPLHFFNLLQINKKHSRMFCLKSLSRPTLNVHCHDQGSCICFQPASWVPYEVHTETATPLMEKEIIFLSPNKYLDFLNWVGLYLNPHPNNDHRHVLKCITLLALSVVFFSC